MKISKKILTGVVAVFSLLGSYVYAEELLVDAIVKKANDVSLYQGYDCKGKLSLVTVDKQGRKRKRELNVLRKNVEGDTGDQKYYTYFLSPAGVRKMVFMVHKNAGMEKDDDRWLYLPSLDLVKRIAASDKRTSFVGSDFLYEDISGRNIYADTHELIETTKDYYVVKNIPKATENVEFAYYIAYISRKTFLPMKLKYFKQDDICFRVIEVVDVANFVSIQNGKEVVFPTVTRSIARNIETGSFTEMVFSKIKYNSGLKDSLFTERYLRKPPREAIR